MRKGGRSVEIVWDPDRKGVRLDDPQRCMSEFHAIPTSESIKIKRARKGY